MKKKIAFISEHASPLATIGGVDSGGQNIYVASTACHLGNMGYEVDVYTRWDDSSLQQFVQYAPNVRVVHIEAGPKEFVPKEELFQYMNQFASNMINLMETQNLNYEIIHAHFWMSGYVAVLVKKILNIPFIITFHALGKVRRIYQGKNDGFPESRLEIEEMIVREADGIIAECPQDKEDLMIHYFAQEENIVIIPCGFNKSEFYPMDKDSAKLKLGLDPAERIILQLGRMVPRKGVDNVIRGLASVLRKSKISMRLLIVGGESEQADALVSPEIGRLRKIAHQENVLDNVTFAGRKNRDQLKYFYNAADVFVSTPWYEPFGITPLEAMACGTPVIGSNVGGIKYSVAHGKTGFLVPPNEPEILSQRISEILDNKNAYLKFSKSCIEHVNTFFTWETVTNEIVRLYEKISKNKVELEKKVQVSFFGLINFLRNKKAEQLS